MKNSALFHNWSIAPIVIQTGRDEVGSGIIMKEKKQQNTV